VQRAQCSTNKKNRKPDTDGIFRYEYQDL